MRISKYDLYINTCTLLCSRYLTTTIFYIWLLIFEITIQYFGVPRPLVAFMTLRTQICAFFPRSNVLNLLHIATGIATTIPSYSCLCATSWSCKEKLMVHLLHFLHTIIVTPFDERGYINQTCFNQPYSIS